jgi:hypothetical protein
MGKNKSASNLVNVIDFNNDRIAFLSGSTTLMSISSSGAITTTGVISGSNAASASFALNAGLLNNRNSAEFVATGSFNTFSSSILTYTGSANSRLDSIETVTGSNITRLSALESASGSAITRLSALETTSGSNITRLNSIESKTGSYATTGSNIFDGGQYLSSSFNPTGFSTTASLYTDGGLRVTRDAYISGTLYLNNVTVFGTQSVAYISSSQLNIGTNLITVNTDTPSIRFGGLAVYDSGSTGLTGSILWDSQDNQWIYSNPTGSEYDSAVFLVGPRNTGVLGNEPGISCNFLSKGNGMHHMTSSGIFEDGSRTCFYGNSFVSSSGAACFSGTVCANYLYSATNVVAGDTLFTGANVRKLSNNQCIFFKNAAGDNEMTIAGNGSVGIGYTNPSAQLQVSGTIATGDSTNGWGRLSFNTNEVRLQASKDGTDPIGISFFTQASGGGFAERMRIACDGRIGIGTTLPSADLQVNKNCDVVVAISNCVGVTTGNRGALAFYNCATSTVALIRAGAVTDNVGTELQFHTRPSAGSLTQVLNLTSAGVACFAGAICSTNIALSQNAILNRASTSAGNNIEWRTASTLNWYIGTRGLTNNNFYVVNEGLSGLSNLVLDASTGAATFACQINAPRLFLNNCSSGAVLSIGNQDSTNDAGVRGLSIITDRLRFGVSPVTSTYGAIATNGTNSGITFVTYDNSWSERARIECTGVTTFACQVCAPSFIANGDFNIRNTSFSTTGTLNKVTWTNLYPSTYNVADFGVQLDGNYYNGAFIFRTADADNANVLRERLRIESRGVACFSNMVCARDMTISAGVMSPTFYIERNSAFDDISTGQYVYLNDPGTQGLNSKFQQQFSPYVNTGEGMTWNSFRLFIRMTSNDASFSTSSGCLRMGSYFYNNGWYCFGCHVPVGVAMDGGRGFKWVVMPWTSYSDFIAGTDVPGLAIYNQSSAVPLRIGAVYIQYKT